MIEAFWPMINTNTWDCSGKTLKKVAKSGFILEEKKTLTQISNKVATSFFWVLSTKYGDTLESDMTPFFWSFEEKWKPFYNWNPLSN